jgi:tRNA-splicing ligase RtcB
MVFKYKNKKYIDDSKNIQIIANKKIFSLINDFSFEQLYSISKLPNIKNIYAMPDIHPGYGVPIGSTFSFDINNALISPEAVGFDINCGIRLIKTNLYQMIYLKKI